MNRLGYATYRGKVYKKDLRSKYTYSYKCEARAFVNTLATNEFFKSRLIREIKKVSDLLADPYCKLFAPLTIDYNLIEVNNGCFWSIKRRDFMNGAIQDHQIGKVSPGAFCPFDSTRDADLKYFREVLENSLNLQEVAKFCDNFLKLLSYNKKKTQGQSTVFSGRRKQWQNQLVLSHSRSHPSRSSRREVPKCPSIHQPVPNAHYLRAKAELRSCRPSRYGQEVENVLLPKPVQAEKEGFSLDEEARHGLCCPGSAEGHGVQRRQRIAER